jgi:hypothetical protein
VLFSDLTPSQHSRLYKLLDEALDLPPGEREVWLGKLVQSDPLLAETLRDLFGFEGTGVLEALRGPLAQRVGKLTQRLKPDEALVGRRFGANRVLSPRTNPRYPSRLSDCQFGGPSPFARTLRLPLNIIELIVKDVSVD